MAQDPRRLAYHLAVRDAGLQRSGFQGRRNRQARPTEHAGAGRGIRIHDHGGQEVLVLPWHRDLRKGHPVALPG